MKCTEAELLIIDLMKDGRMTDPSPDLSGHLASCITCRAFFSQFSKDAIAVEAGKRVIPDPEFYDRLVKTMGRNSIQHSPARKPAGRYMRLIPATATAAAAVFAGIWLGSRLPEVNFPSGTGSVQLSERTAMMNAYAEDVYLYEASDALLENYLGENETEIQP